MPQIATVVRHAAQDGAERLHIRTAAGSATVVTGASSVYLHVDLVGGHRPIGTDRALLDAAFNALRPGPERAVHASIPIGEPDLLGGLHAHLRQVRTRPAGSSCLVDAVLPGRPKPP